ncbi:hypothetical protein QR46_1511 [Giardia duodenalis assemblage B]|uniref:Uncharacterized protein n=1 Tax=Giardia duodenalis assemblage B TaxID=1394984 RepID=A0A132NWL7_GIAIN|nr:hypothetical protein QR46_1511 [Giardia intestinalis assemblage B]
MHITRFTFFYNTPDLEGEHISPFTQHNAVKFNALELALIGSILIGWTLQQSISVVASTMFSDTLLAAQEWILSRVVHYILTSASVRMDMDANIDTNMDTYDLPTDVLNTVTHAISPNQPLTTVDFIAAIRIACSYMLTVFSDKFQFSATYSTKFGASLLRCTRSLTSDTLSARYLSELSALISLHMQHSNAIVSLIVSSECLLDMFSRWLRVILILGQDTGNICTLLSSIISSPIFSTGCVATARYRSGLVIKIFECLDAEVLQAIHAALESDGRQACAHMSGFMEMLVVTNMERLVSEAAPDIAPRLVPFLSAIVQTGVVVQRAKSHLKTSTWADLLAVTNASVLFSMTLIRLADSSKEYSVEVISKLLETTEGSVQELREFLLLQIMRFKVCHQVVDSLDENGMLMLTMLQNRISTILSE